MNGYRLRLRPNPVMQTIAARLSDEEIAALAAYSAACRQRRRNDGFRGGSMTRIHRRRFLAGTGAVVFAGHLARPALAQAKPRVIVIGGRPGGATAAKYIAKDSNGAIEVTLVEPQRAFTTCFHSNLFLGGFRDWASITHSYDKLASGYGVRLVHQAAAAIDRNARTIRLADGSEMGYDRLVVAPGIDLRFDSVPGCPSRPPRSCRMPGRRGRRRKR